MKRIAICYGSRYGTTTGIVEEMATAAREAGVTVDTANLKKEKLPLAIPDYDMLAIGSGIAAGQWTKEPLKFIEENTEELSKRKVALFVVCGDAGHPERCDDAQIAYLDRIAAKYPEINPVSTGLFGGMFEFKKYNFMVRKLVQGIVRKDMPEGQELPEVVDFRDPEKVRNWIANLVNI